MAERVPNDKRNGAAAAATVRLGVQYLAPIVIATAAAVGAWSAIQHRLENVEERYAHLRRTMEELRGAVDCGHSYDVDGFRDHELRLGVDRQIDRKLRDYLRRSEADRRWERLYDRNPSLVEPE